MSGTAERSRRRLARLLQTRWRLGYASHMLLTHRLTASSATVSNTVVNLISKSARSKIASSKVPPGHYDSTTAQLKVTCTTGLPASPFPCKPPPWQHRVGGRKRWLKARDEWAATTPVSLLPKRWRRVDGLSRSGPSGCVERVSRNRRFTFIATCVHLNAFWWFGKCFAILHRSDRGVLGSKSTP
jgi:hypothetical protein